MQTNPAPWIVPFDNKLADSLALVGGKGRNLARLFQAGFPVPPGFLLTTHAYLAYVKANNLAEVIGQATHNLQADDLDGLEQASTVIRAQFAAGRMPDDLSAELTSFYRRQIHGAVAVRSSATAEDLPDMSFAGQQDTYLNIIGEEALLQAVVNCWSSLWTARAIGYRLRNQVAEAGAALAVVVQEMVESQAAGVLFTANPLTGLRSEMVIDAAFGLGEALVSGQVEPDHYVVDQAAARLVSKTLGAKHTAIHSRPEGGTVQINQDGLALQALPDEQILALAGLGARVQSLYDFPQDIEWAWADGQLYLLQSRPITSLFPLPENLPKDSLKVFFSFGAVQGLLDPLTPIGMDALKEIFAAGASLFGRPVSKNTQTALYQAGERLWVNFTPVLSNSVGRKAVPLVLSMVEPSIRQAVEKIQDDPRLQPARQGVSLQGRMRLAHFFAPVIGNVLLNMAAPARRRAFIVARGEKLLKQIEEQNAAIEGDRWQKLARRADILPGVTGSFLESTFRLFVSAVAAGMASWNFLNMLCADVTPAPGESVRDLVLQVTRGMPYNPTTEMDLDIWKIAQAVKREPAALQYVQDRSAEQLAGDYLQGRLPPGLEGQVGKFLQRYGGRGLAEIDLGRTRWADDPTHLFEMLGSFLQIEDENRAPDVVFAQGAQAAGQTVDRLAALVRSRPHGWIKARLVRFFAGRARQLMGARENPKFFAVRMLYQVQKTIRQSGKEFVQAGELAHPDDFFYLTFDELQAFARRESADWASLVAERRARYERELRRKQIPRLLLSDGRAFYEGLSMPAGSQAHPGSLFGSPVSPGVIEAPVRVVLDPRQAGLLPGEILVCPGTDPSWTPLFLSAGGLIMEVGGMMTHGAVVAREYGIPAVVGVHQAVTRLKTGQVVRMDGSSGQILVVEG